MTFVGCEIVILLMQLGLRQATQNIFQNDTKNSENCPKSLSPLSGSPAFDSAAIHRLLYDLLYTFYGQANDIKTLCGE